MTHPSPEVLSAFVDGTEDALSSSDRSEIGAHIASCAECTGLVEGFRFARETLRALPTPEMHELHARQVVRELNRARRRPASRWRALVAVAGTAAAIAAFAAITMIGSGSGPNVLAAGVEVERVGRDFSQTELESVFLSEAVAESDDIAARPPAAMAPPDVSAELTPMAGGSTAGRNYDLSAGAASSDGSRAVENHGARIARCEERIRPGGDGGAIAKRYVVAWYEDIASYILVYEAPRADPDHIEVWVVARDDCRVLHQVTR